MKTVRTECLEIAFEDGGPPDGPPVMHFPHREAPADMTAAVLHHLAESRSR